MKSWCYLVLSLALSLLLGYTVAQHHHEALADNVLSLPELDAVELDGENLKVIATTSIIGDIVANVGAEAINLTTLMQAGQDPHSYILSASDLVQISQAHIVFVNGWDLEESLVENLEDATSTVIVPVSANITPLSFNEDSHDEEHSEHEEDHGDEHHHHRGADPHTWFSIQHVKQWVENIQQSLSRLDPSKRAIFEANAAVYLLHLEALELYAREQFATLPAEARHLVTNHDAFAYLAFDYNLNVIATVIPSFSTLAEPSARQLAELVEVMREYELCTLFTETTSRDALARTVAEELEHCDDVRLVTLYTGALGEAGSAAETYLDMFRLNVHRIVRGLEP